MTLNQFLVKAKINTYASSGEGGEKDLEDGSRELVFQEGDFRYRDRYFGSDTFIGEEVVWKDGKPMWLMNYYGRITSESVPAEEMYQFLQKAMRQITEERPFRGPSKLKEGEFEYIDSSHGAVDDFGGNEKIFYKGEEVYRLYYHGGMI